MKVAIGVKFDEVTFSTSNGNCRRYHDDSGYIKVPIDIETRLKKGVKNKYNWNQVLNLLVRDLLPSLIILTRKDLGKDNNTYKQTECISEKEITRLFRECPGVKNNREEILILSGHKIPNSHSLLTLPDDWVLVGAVCNNGRMMVGLQNELTRKEVRKIVAKFRAFLREKGFDL